MFAKAVIGSARFLRMPASSRLLYYDLCMDADDDGFVEAFGVIRKTGATEDDLRVLFSRGFVKVINEDLVSFITDWKQNNYIRPDRYKESIYHDLLVQIENGISGENHISSVGIPMVDQMETQVRLGKVSVGKDSTGKASTKEREASVGAAAPSNAKTPKKKYGEYGWVQLTDDEYSRLLHDLGEDELKRCILYIDESAQSTGNKNRWKDWNLVVRKCHRDGWGLHRNTPPPTAPRPSASAGAMNDLQQLHQLFGGDEE